MNGHGGGLHLHKDVEFMNTVKNQKFMVQIGVCDGLTLASAPYTGHPWFSALANLDLFLMGAQASLNFIIEPLKNTIVTIITYFTSIFWHHLLMVYFVSLSYNENKVKCSLFLMSWCYIALTRCGFLVINTTRLLLLKENEEIIQSTLYLKLQQAEVQVVLGGHSNDPAFGYRKSWLCIFVL